MNYSEGEYYSSSSDEEETKQALKVAPKNAKGHKSPPRASSNRNKVEYDESGYSELETESESDEQVVQRKPVPTKSRPQPNTKDETGSSELETESESDDEPAPSKHSKQNPPKPAQKAKDASSSALETESDSDDHGAKHSETKPTVLCCTVAAKERENVPAAKKRSPSKAESKVNTTPETEAKVNHAADSDGKGKHAEDAEAKVNSAPEKETKVKHEVDAEATANSAPEKVAKVKHEVDAEAKANSTPETEAKSKHGADSEGKEKHTADSEAKVNHTPDSEAKGNPPAKSEPANVSKSGSDKHITPQKAPEPAPDSAKSPEPEAPVHKLAQVGDSDVSYTSSSYSDSDDEKPRAPVKVIIKSPKKDMEIQKMDYSSSSDSSSYYSDDEGATPVPSTPAAAPQLRQEPQSDTMPPALRSIVFHAKESLTYKALQGVQLQGITQAMLTSVVNDLRKYVDLAVDNGLIDEALYVQQCIDDVRGNKTAEKLEASREIRDLDRKIQEAYAELDERTLFWDTEQTSRERELEMALEELTMSHEAALSELDREWQSTKKQQFYNKPSPALLNLRHVAKKLIRAKKLDEVKKVAALIEAKEREETSEAAKRMNADYHQADAKLKEQYEADKETLISTYEKKLFNISRCREQNLRPIHQRIQNLEKLKREAATTVKKCDKAAAQASPRRPATSATTSRTSRPKERAAQNQLPSLIAKPKLLLPPVQRIKREGGTRSQMRQQTPTGTKNICRPQTLQRLSSAHSSRATSRQNQNM